MEKDQGSVGRQLPMFFRVAYLRVLVADTTPALRATPSARRGIAHRKLLADTTPSAIAATPSARRGIQIEIGYRHCLKEFSYVVS